MTPDPQEVLNLAAQLVEAKAALEKLTKKWDAMFSHNGSAPPAKEKRTDSFAGKVRAVVMAEPGETFTISQVEKMTGGGNLKVGRTLFRLAATGHLVSAGRGLYRAAGEASE